MNVELSKAETWLTELGIKTRATPMSLCVSRDDILNTIGKDEETSFNEILAELKAAVNTKRFFWSGKDDDWLYLETI